MKVRHFIQGEHAATSAEFAMVVVPFVTLIMAGLGLGFILWTNTTLQYAAMDAARCASVRTSICDNKTDTETYAASHYSGAGISPTFTYSATGCGHTVTASATFPLNTGLVDLSVPLAASACFP